MGDTAIRLSAITKIFGPDADAAIAMVEQGIRKTELLEANRQTLALRRIDLSVKRGTIQVVIGLSGSGKSTLVRIINRLIEPSAGIVEVEGENILDLAPSDLLAFRRRRTSMVFQRFALLPHLTAADNVAYGLKIAGQPKDRRRSVAQEWLARVNLDGYGGQYPAQLSGGMQQRVGLARALATGAEILLMDEAFSALDPLIRTEMQTLLLDLQKDLRRTIVFITHDVNEALRLGDRIAILRDGEIVQDGTPEELLLQPADDYVSAFLNDVDRGRVLTLASILSPSTRPVAPDGPTLPADTTLEQAASILSRTASGTAAVLDAQGAVRGEITLPAIVSAMMRRD